MTITSLPRSRAARLVLAASAPALILLSSPVAFAADAPVGYSGKVGPISEDVGRSQVFLTKPAKAADNNAGSYTFLVDGTTKVTAYCVDHFVALDRTKTYTSSPWAARNLDATLLGKAAAIAANGPKIGKALTAADQEAAAEQMAIWTFTNGEKADNVRDPNKRARVKDLIAKVTPLTEGASAYALTETVTVKGDTATLLAHLADQAGAPVVGSTVKFTVGSDVLTSITDAKGDAAQTLKVTKDVRDAVASADVILPAGTLFTSAGDQPFITTGPATVHPAARAAVPAAPAAATPTSTPTPTPKPTTKPVAKPAAPSQAPVVARPAPKPVAQLPFTGTSFQPWMIVALLGVAGAGVAGRKFLRK